MTHGVRGDGQRAQHAPLPRRTPRAKSAERERSESSGTNLFEDRYQPGARRTTAEPLRASWRPAPVGQQPPAGKGGGGAGQDKSPDPPKKKRSKLSAYGWRAYALPVLLVLTALVVFDTANDPPQAADGAETTASVGATDSDTGASREPLATENPPKPVDLKIPTAELPEGGKYTQSGKGTWHVVPGKGEKVGKGGELLTYTVEVEDGLDPATFAGEDAFANSVEQILSNPRGWTGSGDVFLRRVDSSAPEPDFRVSLTSPDTTHRPDMCGFSIQYESSCNLSAKKRVVINLARWVRGAKAFEGDMVGYRQYAINHEVGHALGNGHEGCAKTGELAPVMMQQTFGVSNDYVAKLNDYDPNQGVPADGKVCKPNPWPNP
ncbi:Protein of unknown function [Amycolatopsis marina]|uniref:DUF3152 domain-containing protein n=1 Tax=Amycolatopsis marina TaxID=490629 RepID=A0A1I1BMM5_9PSEU|nr:Protein of unknown function [Amycolatopsis marina]